ncbi:MAG: Vitamin B12 dependent methionine synthase activation subunit [Clostridia bacterium]|nr:Vitamin B12 dependent methionine synthase activation subunit [Clostridia bacterium]
MGEHILIKNYDEPPVNKDEILRYMGMGEKTQEIDNLINESLDEIKGKLNYKVCYIKLPVKVDDKVDFGYFTCESKDLSKNLESVKEAVIFGATIGIEIDRLIVKYTKLSPVKALIFQAIGAERIEALCDKFCREIKKNHFIKPRFSPGYGDFSLNYQKEIFKLLSPYKHIGLTLNESLVMTPSKSVTAIIGISDNFCKEKAPCEKCDKIECEFRRKQ